jgi:hypothetical protein
MTPRNLVFFGVLVLAGCSSEAGDQSAPVTTTTIVSVRPDCAAIADNARGLATELGQLATGDTTVDDVRAAADELAHAVDDAKATVGPDARTQFEEAGQALRQVQDSLAAQPVDWAGVHAGADALVTALRDVADVCDPAPTS